MSALRNQPLRLPVSAVPDGVLAAARTATRIVVLTGAGVSAESGVPTFRDAHTGLWARFRPEELATPQAWYRDREVVFAWYLWRYGLILAVDPNPGHLAVGDLARVGAARVDVVTQNVDDLHERAGSRDVVHLHGSLAAWRCERCEAPFSDVVVPTTQPTDRVPPPRCGSCGAAVRPGVVWFGEALPSAAWDEAVACVEAADLLLVVGTSGLVQPSAGLPALARDGGATVVEINPLDTEVSHVAHHTWRATSAEALPLLAAALA